MPLRYPSAVFASSRRRTSPTQALLATAVLTALAAPVAAQLQFEELPRRGLPIDTDGTLSIAMGDVDGDGDLDMVLGNFDPQNRLYRNDGQGRFTDVTATQMPVETDQDFTVAVELGDVDGDGDLDMVCGNRETADRLYLNNGQGHFTAAAAPQFPTQLLSTTDVALADLDGDGDLDLVVGARFLGNGTDWEDQIYMNDG